MSDSARAALVTALAVAAGYLIGSLPVADAVANRAGLGDLRAVGDGNPGYWNAKRMLGSKAAVPVFAGDAAKGAVAAAVGVLLAPDGAWWMGYVGGGAAMIGHAWPVFARFRGGRSVLAFAGAVCVVAPAAAAISIGVMVLAGSIWRSFAIGARAGVFGFPAVQLVVQGPYRTAATGVLMCIIGVRFAQAATAARRRGAPGVGPPPGVELSNGGHAIDGGEG